MLTQKSRATGRKIIVFNRNEAAAGIKTLRERASVSSLEGEPATAFADASTQVFERQGIAIIGGTSNAVQALADSLVGQGTVEPELYYSVSSQSEEYLRGYRDGVVEAIRVALGEAGVGVPQDTKRKSTTSLGKEEVGLVGALGSRWVDTTQLTWGCQAVGLQTRTRQYDGSGIKVAILDTGLDFTHPDFAGRKIISASFVPGVLSAQDGHGHGTHVAGTAAGVLKPANARAYSVAPGATLLIGKVLDDAGVGTTASILQGIQWAIDQGANIISMSLGSPVDSENTPYSEAYERLAQNALQQGILVIAASGNESFRLQGIIRPVNSPADCPSIMAVASVGPSLDVSWFSCGGVYAATNSGGAVDLAAPGENVFSSWLEPKRYNTISGTSMATPHVAGIAALAAQQSGKRGKQLWQLLTDSCVPTLHPVKSDVGSGLVQAPSSKNQEQTYKVKGGFGTDYIVAFDLSDPAVSDAANWLNKTLNNPKIVDVNQVEDWPNPSNGCTLYIIDHGDGRGIGDYNNPNELLKQYEKLNVVYNAASKVVLVSCSTANEADLLLKNDGFQAATFAKNLKAVDKNKVIFAAVGPVVTTSEGLVVRVPNGAIGFASDNGWVKY